MRICKNESGITLWLSARDTSAWARGYDPAGNYHGKWLCAASAGKRIVAAFDRSGNLVDLAVNGGRGDQDIPCDEFNALVSDCLVSAGINPDSPC